MPAPRIGITSADRTEELVTSPWYEENYSVPAQYVDAVRRAGGIPVVLPPGEPDAAEWLGMLDGVVVTGGSDVAADRYGGDPTHPRQELPRHERDSTEFRLTEAILASDVPALFVCRGMQVLNVALGGTLLQHLADHIQEDIHRAPSAGWTYHDADLEPGSLIAKAAATERVSGATGHHQAVARLAEGLKAVGWAEDGTVEAVEMPDRQWIVGVQWHPEVSAATDPAQQGLFDALVAVAS